MHDPTGVEKLLPPKFGAGFIAQEHFSIILSSYQMGFSEMIAPIKHTLKITLQFKDCFLLLFSVTQISARAFLKIKKQDFSNVNNAAQNQF